MRIKSKMTKEATLLPWGALSYRLLVVPSARRLLLWIGFCRGTLQEISEVPYAHDSNDQCRSKKEKRRDYEKNDPDERHKVHNSYLLSSLV
jgi:hypothetical protein